MSALLDKFNILADKGEAIKTEDAMDTTWAALAVEGDPPNRMIGTFLIGSGG